MADRLDAILADGVPRVCSAAVALIAVDGAVAAASTAGELVRYTDAGGTLAERRPPARRDSIFDLASVSKLFTTAVVLSLAEEGRLDLDAPVAGPLGLAGPRGATGPRGASDPPGAGGPLGAGEPPGAADPRVTARRLLTHTAGLPPTRRIDLELPGAGPEERMAAMLRTPVTGPVGGLYLYSDVGMVMAGRLAEVAGGAPLDELVRLRVTGPLGLAGTGYRPRDVARAAATEWLPERPGPGCVRGEVHDETAYALGGVAGHAGLFAPADDLLAFGEALRLGGGPVLRPQTVAEMTRDQGAEGAAFRHGLGVRIGDPAIVGPLSGAWGHSGFTGTSLVVDPARRLTVVLLTNAVHPVRGRDGIRGLRHAVAEEALRLTS
ncbi:serine hydrolase domain-containing protein [Nonomuraea pusilla]|uniref:CubicO group peptidase, beta-lactamase class C family n=1 Tax=Nonomuraea pusilla TaxID=46177 RepID=A0A1H7XN80_9ACTN|nr:serine hydrolase domain-containing protein [Nonomuraea pusilla]SEM34647.1 CubicO group peptidase, beta-lactamase class C family [Nonomuraea pusilla]